MRCTFPKTVGFKADGKTIAFSSRQASKEYASFQIPCGKCLSCRLEHARGWAIRAIHEAQLYEKNSFITLTYDDDHVGANRLDYRDFQLFMKKLREESLNKIRFMAVGEYGEKSKRKHWHAILFNWLPGDAVYSRSTPRGDRCFTSSTLDRLWGYGITELGGVTADSAGYVARYSAKKLVHGKDGSHDYNPIFKASNRPGIGATWLEKYWKDVFNHGHVILPNGSPSGVPRYYEKWLLQHKPEAWLRYVTHAKSEKIDHAQKKAAAIAAEELKTYIEWEKQPHSPVAGGQNPFPMTRSRSRALILESNFRLLQKHLKL